MATQAPSLFVANGSMFGSGERVGFVLRAKSYEDAIECAITQHPDKYDVEILNYTPVWLKAFNASWRAWSHLRGPGRLLLAPFALPKAFPVYDTPINLLVEAFSRRFDPFTLSEWIFGVRVSRQHVRDLIPYICEGPYRNFWRHSERIAYLSVHPSADPIQVTSYSMGRGVRWIVDDGKHRYAAAIIASVKTLPAVTTKNLVKELVDNGFAES